MGLWFQIMTARDFEFVRTEPCFVSPHRHLRVFFFYLLEKYKIRKIYPCFRVHNDTVQNMKRVIAGDAVSRDADRRVQMKFFPRGIEASGHFESGSFLTLAMATNAISFTGSKIPNGPRSQSQHVKYRTPLGDGFVIPMFSKAMSFSTWESNERNS